jgi:hypothetical protein
MNRASRAQGTDGLPRIVRPLRTEPAADRAVSLGQRSWFPRNLKANCAAVTGGMKHQPKSSLPAERHRSAAPAALRERLLSATRFAATAYSSDWLCRISRRARY